MVLALILVPFKTVSRTAAASEWMEFETDRRSGGSKRYWNERKKDKIKFDAIVVLRNDEGWDRELLTQLTCGRTA